MMMPNAHLAAVDRPKIVDYLLNAAHPDNGGKAGYFQRLGFSREHWEVMRDALRQVAVEFPVADLEQSSHGRKYIVTGELIGPSRAGFIRSVWIVEHDSELPRLVTAYPQR